MLYQLNQHLPVKVIGQKASRLAWLKAHGFCVPESMVLSTAGLTLHLRENGLWERAVAGGDLLLATAISEAPMPLSLQEDLSSKVWSLGTVLVVRSSAVDEDGKNQSFAGQYESYLEISQLDEFFQAVKNCWASYFLPRVLLYRGHNRINPSGMAVLIQRQLRPSHAGVCFSINPMTGSWRELVVEAFPGLGNQVVDGSILPDYYRLERPARLLPIGLRLQLRSLPRVLEQHCKSEAVLSIQQLASLRHIALKLERQYGQPQDIEWGIESGTVFLLQHRPITAHAQLQEDQTLWSQAFIGERWAEPASYLGWSLMAELLSFFIDYPLVSKRFFGGDPALKKHQHAPYLNLSPFRHLLFKWPGAAPPQFMLELLPPSEAQHWRQRFAAMPNLSFYRSILKETITEKRWHRFSWNPLSNWKDWDEFDDELTVFLKKPRCESEDISELWYQHLAHYQLAKRYIGIHICSLLFANIGYQLLHWMLGRKLSTEERHQLLRSYRTTPTTLANQALWDLANNHIKRGDFIAEFGHRAPNSWEIFSPRWSEEPHQIDQLMALISEQDEPMLLERASLEQAHDIMCKINAFDQWGVRDVQRYLYLREAQRFSFDRLLWSWKQVFNKIGSLMGIDLRWLNATELEIVVNAFVHTGQIEEKWLELIRERSIDWEQARDEWRNGNRPSFVLHQSASINDERQKRLNGIGISPGVVCGPARVLNDISEAALLQPGEILVVRSTDPAWTPLFMPSAGIVLELGGMLSHGAIVARECGTPAVSAIQNATKLIKTGEIIEIDGQRGWVYFNP